MATYFYNGRQDFKLMSQKGVKCFQFEGEPNNSVWDSMMGPDGTLYMSLSSEIIHSGYARLYSFDYRENAGKKLMEIEKVILPQDRAIRASKFHTSISFMNDGNLIMTTHSTDKAPQHPTWLPEAYYGHMWEGFAGSHIVTYDLKTGEGKNLGIPAPRESMYGSVFDAKHNALYSLGYMRGHLYRYSLDDRSVKDLGKVTEGGCFRMVIGPDGNIYTSSKSGYLFKVDTKTQKIIDMNFRVPMHFYGDNYTCENSFGIFSEAKVGPDGRIYFAIMYGPDILALDTKTGEIENLGPFIPTDRYAVTENRNGVFGIDFDSKGVMWYFVNPVSDGSEPEQPAQPSSLFRWDVLNGGKPQWAGILGCPDRIPTCASKLFIHDDHIMVVDTNHGSKPAAVITIDLREFDPEGYALVDPETLNDPMFHLNDEEQFGYSRMFDDQVRFMAANPHTFAGNGGELCGAVRLWRALAPDHIDDSNVAALAWDDENGLNGICGKEQKYGFRIVGDELDFITELEKLDKEYAAWLEEAVKPVEFTGTGTLPGYPGRQYKAVPTACAELTEGRQFVGTLDGMAAVCKGDKAYSVGMCGYNGPVRAAASTPDKKVVYGVAGDESDFGMVFRYDDENGLQLLGDIKHSSSRTPYGYITCNVLSACAISKDGSYLAIGSADRMGTVLIYKLK